MQDKYVDAEPHYERAQAIQENVLGPEHPDVAKTLNDRAVLWKIQVRAKRFLWMLILQPVPNLQDAVKPLEFFVYFHPVCLSISNIVISRQTRMGHWRNHSQKRRSAALDLIFCETEVVATQSTPYHASMLGLVTV